VADTSDVSSGLVMGTVKYMSPEQARGLSVDPRSDIFSFGIVLYEMLASRAPFEGDTSSELIAAISKKEPPPLTSLPDEMQRLVSRALRKKREERYQTIQILLDDLKALREDKAITGGGTMAAQSADGSTSSTIDTHPLSTTSSIESIVSGIKRHKTGAAVVLASLVVVAVGLTFGLSRFVRQRAASSQMKIARVPNMDKAEEVAISPDGKYIAQIARPSGQNGIYLVELATGSSVPILIAPAKILLSGLTFSQDGEKVFYVSAHTLYQVPVRGGDAEKVMADVDDSLSIAPDYQQAAFVRFRDSDHESALTIVNVDGSGERVLATRRGPKFLGQPVFSPDGRLIVCSFGLNASNQTESLIAFDVATGDEKPITNRRWQGFVSVRWIPDGSGLVAAAQETSGGPTQLWHISYPNGEVRRITNDLENYGALSLTGDGKSLLTIQGANRTSLWIMPKENPGGARPITSNDRDFYRMVSFTPDDRLLFPADVSGTRDIWIMNADGTNLQQLTRNAGANILPKASPDGQYIVFTSNRDNRGAFNIWRMDMDGSNPIQLTHGSGETDPVCSPDGRWVVYSKGGPEVNAAQKTLWRIPIDGGEPVQLTTRPSSGAAISPDGTGIACKYKQDATSPWQIAVIPFTGGQPIKLFDAPQSPPNIWLRWTPDGRAISYVSKRGGNSNIWSQPVGGGPPQQVTPFTSEEIGGFDWSRDGTLVCSRGHWAQDVVLMTDFK
jgi:Tol biopolymer transport system component